MFLMIEDLPWFRETMKEEVNTKRFGTWKNALVEAGIYEKALSKEKIIEQLKQHYLKNPDMTVESFEKDRAVCSNCKYI